MKKLLAVCLAVLILLLTACGIIPNNKTTAPTEPETTLPPVGTEIGNLCPSFRVEIGSEDGATGEFVDPTDTGKVTVINFWGTWCNPCTSELPHFDQFARENDVNIYAIHSVEGKKKMPQFIAEYYSDSPIVFCYDEPSEESFLDKYFSLLGGYQGYPYTVVLDADGVILHTQTGMMSYEDLEAIVNTAK